MTTASQLKKTCGDNHWLVKNEQGETFGPVAFETLKLWAKDGRLAPTNILSENATTWSSVTQYPELEMDWVTEVSPGTFYGPIHKLALEALKKEGALPADAVAFQRPPTVRSARKTQPISAISPVAPPHPKNDSDAVRALERQLDLERQRSHDMMKQLDQIRNTVSVKHEPEAQGMVAELAKTQELLSSVLTTAQREATSQATQAVSQVTQAVLLAIEPVASQLMQHRQELERFGALIHASRTQTAEAVVSAVAPLLENGREQMTRATGDSQRITSEYIVREITAILTQALQAGRENLMQGMRGGWAEVQEQAASVNARLAELQASQGRLEEELKAAIQKRQESSKPVVERIYVEAEAVEVIPPERPRKKIHPEPEIEDPPRPTGKTGPTNATGPGLSMADIEQQARRELERLGSQGMNIFKRKK